MNCVIVKDLSRFGRDYIESGRYIQKTFPDLGVRFIALTDHYEPLVTSENYEKVCLFHKGMDTSRKREKNPLVGKLICGGCGYSMVDKPIRRSNKYRKF